MSTDGDACEQAALYPIEFWVAATPVSLQSSRKSKDRWKQAIRSAVSERIRETDDLGFLDHRPTSATIYYFTSAPMQGDIDNIVKPILDALVGMAFLDDRSVERLTCQKFEPHIGADFGSPSDRLALALKSAPPIVYVRIDDDLSWRRL